VKKDDLLTLMLVYLLSGINGGDIRYRIISTREGGTKRQISVELANLTAFSVYPPITTLGFP
jgi:hypothetical protein